MSQDHDAYRETLAAELQRVYKDGLNEKIEAVSIPILAELAEGISGEKNAGEKDYYGLQVENLLRMTIRRLEKTKKRREGLEKLFGIASEERVLGLDYRRDDAAKPLGYKNKETLRHGKVNKRPFADVILEELLDQMLVLATEYGFVYTARYGESVTQSDERPDNLSGDSTQPSLGVPTVTVGEVHIHHRAKNTRRRGRLRHRLVVAIGGGMAVVIVFGAALLMGAFSSSAEPNIKVGFFPKRPVWNYNIYDGNKNCSDPTNVALNYGRCGPTTGPVFDSFIHVSRLGDERNFLNGYRTDHWQPLSHVNVVRDVTGGSWEVGLRIYISNDANQETNASGVGIARGTTVRVALPTGASKALRATARISATNAAEVGDEMGMTGTRPFRVEYVEDSAMLYNNGPHKRGIHLSENILKSGVLVGYNKLDGSFPAGWEYQATITLKVRVEPEVPV